MRPIRTLVLATVILGTIAPVLAHATSPASDDTTSQAPRAPGQAARPAQPARPADAVAPPADYLIGPDDVLAVLFWREKDLSVDSIAVRPDGKITLPLINDIQAAGLTPDQLREAVQKAAAQYVEEPNATIVIKTINSRRVFVTGMVNKPGPYPLGGPTTVLQALALAGGIQEFAKKDKITVLRSEQGKTSVYKFNYKDVTTGKKLEQNIVLKPGDTVVVP